jgi:hypothetical protein
MDPNNLWYGIAFLLVGISVTSWIGGYLYGYKVGNEKGL